MTRTSKTLWLVPAAAALVYPLLLDGYSAVVHAGVDSATSAQRLMLFAAASALILAALAVPCMALRSLLELNISAGVEARFLRRLLHVAVATPPAYVLASQVTYAVGLRTHPNALWYGAWVLLAAMTWWRVRGTPDSGSARAHSMVGKWIPALRVTHGVVALTLLLGFLIAHIANHVVALWSVEAHQAVMKVLRLWYRAPLVEPIVLGSCAVMIATGLILVGFHTRTASDRYRTVQTAAGAYLVAFMLAHTYAILSGRSADVETDWLYASGGPAGLLLSASYYLIPYYLLAVIAVSTHVALGLRIVLLEHRMGGADHATRGVAAFGAVTAVLITAALLGVHVR